MKSDSELGMGIYEYRIGS